MDLKNPKAMHAKAILFVLIGLLSFGLALAEYPTLKHAALMLLMIWAFSRAYYFAFYVLQHYIDPGFRFAGLTSAIRHVMTKRHDAE